MEIGLTQFFNGLSVSSILLLIALGLSITFGLMKVINMAHGELIMIGASTAYVVQNLFADYMPASMFGWYFAIAIPVSFIVAFVFGLVLEMGLIRFLYG